MDMFITHNSALEYWRLHGSGSMHDILDKRQRKKAVPTKLPGIEGLRQLGSLELSVPVDVSVSTSGARRLSRMIRSHVIGESLPEGSIVSLRNNLYVSSPELCFLQMASRMSLIKLVELGFELCGNYSLPGQGTQYDSASRATATDPVTTAMATTTPTTADTPVAVGNEQGFYGRLPLTNVKRLTAFLASMPGAYGVNTACKAVQFIAENSASPMETILTMLLTLPYRHGGYGLPMPLLNATVKPARSARQNVNQETFICDLLWQKHNLAAEYDSDTYHTGSVRIARDSRRRNSLTSIGVTVITVTNQNVQYRAEFARVARQLASKMGKQLRTERNPNFTEAQIELRRLLLPQRATIGN